MTGRVDTTTGGRAMGVAELLTDNPILVKHVRSRLRPWQTVPWIAIALVLSACTAWAGHYALWIGDTTAVTMLLGLQVLALVFGGTNQISSSLGGARESGILDFHRVSPVSPAAATLGFFLGAPIREYLLAAVTLPFLAYSAYHVDPTDSWKGLSAVTQIEVGVLLTTWVLHALTVLVCLTRKKARGSAVSTIASAFIVLVVGYVSSLGVYFGSQFLLQETPRLNLFGLMLPWPGWLLIYEVPLLGFLGLASTRKMRSERAHAFTKAQALACMTTMTVLTVGGLWKVARLLPEAPPFEPTPADAIMLAAVYVLALTAMVLALSVTPDAGEYLKGLRRATHEGRRRPSAWSDAGSNRVALFALCALVLLGATAVVQVVGRPPVFNNQYGYLDPIAVERAKLDDAGWLAVRQSLLSRPIAIAVLTVAYVGLAYQFFALRTRRSGMVLLFLFLFATWLLPLLAGAGLGMSGPADAARTLTVLAISPVPGIALSSGLAQPPGIDGIRLAALGPAIAFAFIFNYLLVMTQRRLDHRLRSAEKPALVAAPTGKWELA